MATSGPTNLPAFFSTDANFQSFVTGIHAALAGFTDLTQTTDTGQINPATVTKPAATNTSAGYEIWRFNDTAQSTRPVFLKLEYGTSGATDRPSLWFTIGTGSNGSGTLTGAGTRFQFAASASKTSGTQLPAYFACGPGWLNFVVNFDSTTATFAMGFTMERTRDTTGASTTDGVWAAASVSGASTGGATSIALAGTLRNITAGNGGPAARPPDGTTFLGVAQVGSDIAIATPIVWFGKPFYGSGCAAYDGSTIVSGTAFTATVLGSTRTYLAIGAAGANFIVGGLSQDSGTTNCAAIRFD